jgi:hypothetical protein
MKGKPSSYQQPYLLQRLMEYDKSALFDTPFNRHGRAVAWLFHSELKKTTQAVIAIDGSICYHSSGLLTKHEKAAFLFCEPQPVREELLQLKSTLKLDRIDPFYQGWARVRKLSSRKAVLYNYINPNGRMLSSQWFTNGGHFCNGRAKVRYGGGLNYITPQGEYLFSSSLLFDAEDFEGDYARVKLKKDDQWHLVDLFGSIVSEGFSGIGPCSEGKYALRRGTKYNYMDLEHNLLCENWIFAKKAGDFSCGWALLTMNYGKYNYISHDGTKMWSPAVHLRSAHDFKEGYALVHDLKFYNLLSTDGTWFFQKWKPDVKEFDSGVTLVSRGNQTQFYDGKGDMLRGDDFKQVDYFKNGFARVLTNEGYNFIGRNGKFLSPNFFEEATEFYNGRACVQTKSGRNFLTVDGKFLLPSKMKFRCTMNKEAFLEGPLKLHHSKTRYYMNWHGDLIGD